MSEKLYSVEEVARLLGLHVRTVRGYIRSGRLKAVRIGKQYRIAPADLERLTGRTLPARPSRAARVEVSSIVQIDGIDRAAADRLGTLVLAGANTTADPTGPLHVQTIHDKEQARLKIVIMGGATATADLLRLLDAVLDGENGLLTGRDGNA
ncbi:helix-turn-helix domain-containing protein [Thermomonospora sp. CIF 1]|uniref:helix-turn-helix domain-containing protein n=1 Tax=Thermomonospora sp. CIF 1 TaxID=1916083 RepID=UPI000AD9413C|nr:helix-turn-helix domain-containing protein [Thermomonospora sp. CIF 1]PKK12646.1 MAG: DNA-binding protein [Thermomonospora sp. CIF 1]